MFDTRQGSRTVFKSPLEMSLEERKSILIQRRFLEMADVDYLSARWAYSNGMFHNFYWLAAQCIEKYLKAALLYNCRSVKNVGHDLKALFLAVGEINQEFNASTISMPYTTGMGRDAWHEKPMALFVDYLHRYGSPDARYSLNDTFINGPVIHPLDSLRALARRFIRYNNFLSDDLFRHSEAENSGTERLDVDRDWMIRGELLLERLSAGKYHVGEREALRETFRNMNFAFFDERTDGEATFGGLSFAESPMANYLFYHQKLDGGAKNTRIISELRNWAKDNIKLTGEIRDALRSMSE